MLKMKSNNALAIIHAYTIGYRIIGLNVFSSKGNSVKPYLEDGYPAFSVRFNGHSIKIKCHRFVAYQKYGEKMFEEGICVRHIDNNPLNFNKENIAIGTHSDNMMDIIPEVRLSKSIAAARHNSKLTDSDVLEIRKMLKEGCTIKAICEKYNIAKSTASYIKNRITYKYL